MATKKSVKKKTTKQVKQQLQAQSNFTPTITMGKWEEAESATILANEYFNGVKTKSQKLMDDKLIQELQYLPSQIEELIQLGQTGLADKLKKNIVALLKKEY